MEAKHAIELEKMHRNDDAHSDNNRSDISKWQAEVNECIRKTILFTSNKSANLTVSTIADDPGTRSISNKSETVPLRDVDHVNSTPYSRSQRKNNRNLNNSSNIDYDPTPVLENTGSFVENVSMDTARTNRNRCRSNNSPPHSNRRIWTF